MLVRVLEELRGLGYAGGYDAIRRYAKTWRRERSGLRPKTHFKRSAMT